MGCSNSDNAAMQCFTDDTWKPGFTPSPQGGSFKIFHKNILWSKTVSENRQVPEIGAVAGKCFIKVDK